MVVQDINRPDVNGVQPLMYDVCEKIRTELMPVLDKGLVKLLKITTDDNLCSSVYIRGSFDYDASVHGCIENSRHFKIMVNCPNTHYYTGGNKLTVHLFQGWKCTKFRKSTSTVEKITERIIKWVNDNKNLK